MLLALQNMVSWTLWWKTRLCDAHRLWVRNWLGTAGMACYAAWCLGASAGRFENWWPESSATFWLICLMVGAGCQLKHQLGDWPKFLHMVSSYGLSLPIASGWVPNLSAKEDKLGKSCIFLWPCLGSHIDSINSTVLHWPGPLQTLPKFKEKEHQPQISV